MVTAAAVYYHKEMDSFSDSSYEMLVTKHEAGQIKKLSTFLYTPTRLALKRSEFALGKQESEGELQITTNRLILFPLVFPVYLDRDL